MNATTLQVLLAFTLYLAGMVFIGLRASRKNETAADFFLGSRQMGPWITAFSAEASDMSGWLLMGLPGVAYLTGMKEAFWTALGLTVGTWLNWLVVAKRLRKYTIHSKDSITIPEFFTNRFRDKSRLISFVSVVFILIFFTIYTASGFVACAKLFNSVFGFPYVPGLLLGIAVILAYTLAGGYLAVCSTDFVQGTLMFIALAVTTIIGAASLGGPAAAVAKINAFGAEFLNPFVAGPGDAFGPIQIISALAWGLGYFGMPHILVRFMAIKSEKLVKRSATIAIVWVVISLSMAIVVGVVGKMCFTAAQLPDQENVFIALIQRLFMGFGGEGAVVYAPLLGGLFLCGILAAIMSTSDSQLLVTASSFTSDIYKTALHKGAGDRHLLWVSRISVIVIALIAYLIATNQNSSVMGLVSNAWSGFGSTFGAVVLLSLYWKRINRAGAAAGLLGGGLTVIVWDYIPVAGSTLGTTTSLYSLAVGFVVSLVLAICFSLGSQQPDEKMLEEFALVKSGEDVDELAREAREE